MVVIHRGCNQSDILYTPARRGPSQSTDNERTFTVAHSLNTLSLIVSAFFSIAFTSALCLRMLLSEPFMSNLSTLIFVASASAHLELLFKNFHALKQFGSECLRRRCTYRYECAGATPHHHMAHR